MKIGFNDRCLDHTTGERHPESPERLIAIRRELDTHHTVEYVEPSPATIDDLALVHDRSYLEAVRDFCGAGGGEWDPDTVAVEATWEAGLASVGLAQWAARTALDVTPGRDSPFAIGRPPGHHAVRDDAMGFCFFNNAAIAAQSVLEKRDIDQVAILDWDVHHGNGTQSIFYDRSDVLFASIHEDGLYPGTGDQSETGTGTGLNYTVNLPLPPGAGDAAVQEIVSKVLEPKLHAVDPDLILISAGFDAHRHDPISRLRVSTEGYGWLTAWSKGLADSVDAGLGFILEGGYSLDMLAEGVGMVTKVFAGYEPVQPDGEPDEAVGADIDSLIDAHNSGSK